MNCRKVHRYLLPWVEGELDEATWLSIAKHLDNCEGCQAEVQRLRQVIKALQAISSNDEVPTIPQRLWQKLTPRRKRLPSFAAIFVTACIAFLLGWQARSIASSSQPLQVNAPATSAVNGKIERKQDNLAQKQFAFTGNLTAGSGKVISRENLKQSNQLPLSDRLSSVPTSFSRSRPLTLSGATALAWGNELHSNRLSVNSLPRRLDFDDDSITNEMQNDRSEIELDTELVWVFVPVEIQQPEPQPYRIFVQVTDTQTQTVRTIKVDATDPQHIVAEWSEVNSGEISN